MKKRLATAGVLSLAVGGVLFGATAAMADPSPGMFAVQHCSSGGPAVTVTGSGAVGITTHSNNCGGNGHVSVQQHCSSGGSAAAHSGTAGIAGHSNGCGNNGHTSVQQHCSSGGSAAAHSGTAGIAGHSNGCGNNGHVSVQHHNSHSSHSSYSSYSSHSSHGHEHTVIFGGDGFDDEDCPFLDDEDTGNDCPDDNGGTPGKRTAD